MNKCHGKKKERLYMHIDLAAFDFTDPHYLVKFHNEKGRTYGVIPLLFGRTCIITGPDWIIVDNSW